MDPHKIKRIAANLRQELAWTSLSNDWEAMAHAIMHLICQHDYRCVAQTADHMDGNLGFFDPALREIRYCKSLKTTPYEWAQVLAHELMHMCLGHDELITRRRDAARDGYIGSHSWLGQDHPRAMAEAEANAGALELLLPADLVAEHIMQEDGNVAQLASQLEVPQLHLAIQLTVHHARLINPSQISDLMLADELGDTMVELSEEQQAAAYTTNPFAIVSAGPGCGKTTTLVYRVRHLLEQQPSGKVLVLSYSRAAAAELSARLGDSNSATSCVWPSTLHAFARRLLLETGHDGRDLDVVLTPHAEHDLWRQAIRSVELPNEAFFLSPHDQLAEYCAQRVDYIKATNLDMAYPKAFRCRLDSASSALVTWFFDVWEAYETLKEKGGACDFGDLVVLAARALEEDSSVKDWVATHIDYLLADELQDTNPVQQILLERLTKVVNNFWGVGDTRQAIYRFQGAYPEVMTHIAERFEAQHFSLTGNRRSVSEIVTAAERLAHVDPRTRFEDGFRAIRTDVPQGGLPPLSMVYTSTPEQLEHEFIRRIRLVRSAGVSWDNIAVLCARQASATQARQLLSRAGIPHRSARSIDPHGPWASILIVWHELSRGERFDESSKQRIRLGLSTRGLNTEEIDDAVEWAAATAKRLSVTELSRAPSPFVIAATMVYELSWLRPSHTESENVCMQIDAFLTCARAHTHAAAWTSRAQLWSAYFQIYEALREAVMEGTPVRPDALDSGQTQGVRVTTMHQSKGTEFDVVIAFDASPYNPPPQPLIHRDLLKALQENFVDVMFEPNTQTENEQRDALWFVTLTRARNTFIAFPTPRKAAVAPLVKLETEKMLQVERSDISVSGEPDISQHVRLPDNLSFGGVPLAPPNPKCKLLNTLKSAGWPAYRKKNSNALQRFTYENILAQTAIDGLSHARQLDLRTDTAATFTEHVKALMPELDAIHQAQLTQWGTRHLHAIQAAWHAWLTKHEPEEVEFVCIQNAIQHAGIQDELNELRKRYGIVQTKRHGILERVFFGLTTEKPDPNSKFFNHARYTSNTRIRYALDLAARHLECTTALIYNMRSQQMDVLEIRAGKKLLTHGFTNRVTHVRDLIEKQSAWQGKDTPSPHRCRKEKGCPHVAVCPVFHPKRRG